MREKRKGKGIKALVVRAFSGSSLGRTMLFGGLILLAVAGASILRMKAWTVIAADGYVLTEDVSNTLKNGLDDSGKERVALYPVSAYQEVYSRMGTLYVGEELQKLEKTYPQFLGSGSGVRFLAEGSSLIGEDMTTYLPVYDGLRVNDGNSFGEDGYQADVENFILLGLSNGLYMNAQNMKLTFASVTETVPSDSILYFDDSEVRCYVRDGDALQYREITRLMAARIQIGNLDMDYRDFLERLRSRSSSGVDQPAEPSEWKDLEEGEEAGTEEGSVTDSASEQDTDKTDEETGDLTEPETGKDTNSGDAGEHSSDKGDGSGSSGTSEAGGTSDSSGSENHDRTDDTGEEAGNGSGSETEDDSTISEEGTLDIGDHVPVVTPGDFVPEVYHIYTKVQVEDEYGQLYKLTYTLYWGTDDLKTVRMRKSVRGRQLSEDGTMDIDLSLVPPGTTVRIEGTFTYYNKDQEKIEKEFLPEGGVTVKTMTIQQGLDNGLLSRIQIKYDQSQEVFPRLPGQIQLPELQTDVSDGMKEYLYRVAVRATVHGKDTYMDIPLLTSELKQLKQGDPVLWISENTIANTGFLTSNTVFDYQILLQDKFGNDLPLEVLGGTGSEDMEAYLSGTVATARKAPTVTITEKRVTNPDAVTIGDKTLTIKLNNPDEVPLLAELVNTEAGEVGRKIYLQAYAVTGGEETLLAIDSLANPQLTTLYEGSWIVLDPEQMVSGSGQEVIIHNLPADKSITYSFKVFANYNLTPENDLELEEEQDIYGAQIGSYQSASLAITRLGYGYYNLTASATDTTAEVTANMTNSTGEGLRGLFSRFELQLLEGNTSGIRGAREKYTVQLRRSDFYEGTEPIRFPSSGNYVLASETGKYTVTIQGTAGEEIWKTLCYDNPALQISYVNLNSTLYYQVKINTYVEQGYTGSGIREHDVTGTSNTTSFRMLKLKPTVSAENFYTVSDFIEIRGLQIYDKDGVITGTSTDLSQGTSGNVIVQLQVRNGGVWENAQSRVVNTTTDPDSRLENIRFKGLGKNQEYRVKFIAVSYNDTWSSQNEQTAKELSVVQDEWMLTTGTGITSSLALLGASEALAYVDEGSLDSLNLIDSESVSTGCYYSENGTLVQSTSRSYWVTDFTKVTPGDVLMLYRTNRGTNHHYVCFYTDRSDESIISLRGTTRRLSLNVYTYQTKHAGAYGEMDYILFRVPEGVHYLKLSAYTSTAYQSGPAGTKLLSLGQMGLMDPTNPDAIFNGGEMYTEQLSGDIKKGYMYNAVSNTEVANGSYSLSRPMSVRAGQYYVKTGGDPTAQSYVGFYDEEGHIIDALDNIYTGFRFQAPEGAVTMRIADYTACVDFSDPNRRLSVYEYNSEMVDSGKILQADDSGEFYANVRSQVSDPSGDLLVDPSDPASGSRSYVIRWYSREGIDGADTTDPLLSEEEVLFDGTSVTNYHQRRLNGYSSFCVGLWVELYGEEILLSELCFTTEEVTYSIACDEDLDKLAMFPYGKFVVVEDFTSSRASGVVTNFYGKIDGQGHTITRGSLYYLIGSLRDGAEVKNLDLDWNFRLEKAFSGTGCLAAYNYGTISNIIVHMNLSGAFPLSSIGGICEDNYGTIENFAISYENDLTVRSYFGGACRYNYGVVQNGYAYVPSNVRVNFTSAQYLGNPNNVVAHDAGLVGSNQPNGIVRNLYMVGNVYVEKQTSSWNTCIATTGVGYNQGKAEGLLVRGDRYTYTINDLTNVQSAASVFATYGGNTIGARGGSYSEKNIYYISPQEYTYSNKSEIKADDSDLWNITFMDTLLNSDGQFRVEEMVQAGYYPQVQMPESMMEKQPSVPLPGAVGAAAPEVLDARMVESGTDEAGREYVIANIRFLNSRKRQVTEIVIDGLDCEILSYPEGSKDYTVQVKLSDPQYFRSSYELKSFTYRASAIGDATRTVDYGADTANGVKYLNVEFWKSISSVAEWNQYLGTSQLDMEGNYQIIADLDFAGQSASGTAEIARKSLGNGQYEIFHGKLRGYDPANQGHVPVIRNYPAEKGYVMEAIRDGSVENLVLEKTNYNFDSSSNLSDTVFTDTGFIGSAERTELRHIQLRSIEIPAASKNAGALAGTLSDCTVQYCSASDVQITSVQPAGTVYSLSIGGLIGKSYNTAVTSCYVSGAELVTEAGSDAEGVGGLIGWTSGNGRTEDCYAQGTISSNFGCAGGLIGKSGCSIRRVWTDVSVISVANSIGGILGGAEKSLVINGAFAAGEVYSKTGSLNRVGRIFGSEIGNVTVTSSRTFAYEGQMLNGQSSEEKLDAYGIMDSTKLSGSNARSTWSRRIGFGNAFRIQGEDSPEQITGLLPYLLDEDGEQLLPGQTAHMLKDLSLSMNPVAYRKDVPGKTDSDYPYQLNLSFVQKSGESLYKVLSVSVEGMEVAEAAEDQYLPETSQTTSVADGTVTTQFYVYTGLLSYQDNYRVTLTVGKDDGSLQTLSSVLQFEEGDIPYLVIHDFTEWKQYLGSGSGEKALGQSYQNLMIDGTVDFSEGALSSSAMSGYLNIRAGKVKGTERAVLKNLNYQAAQSGEAVFADITGNIEQVEFKNMTLDVSAHGGSSIGMIGHLQGDASNLKFSGVTVKGGAAAEVGCIGTCEGSITDSTLDNIRISARGNYVGGLAGLVRGKIERVTLSGSNTDYTAGSEGGEGTTVYGSLIENTGNYQGTGGICGIGYDSFVDLTVTGTQVKGYQRIGGVSGYTNQAQNMNLKVGSPDPKDKDDEPMPYDVAVEGRDYVAGVAGWVQSATSSESVNYYENNQISHVSVRASQSHAAGIGNYSVRVRQSQVEDCYIFSASSYAGGITSYYSNVSDSVVRRCTIQSGIHSGGIASYGNNVTDCSVYDCIIQGGRYVGGIIGGIGNHTLSGNGVSNCTIGGSTSQYVGGIVGGCNYDSTADYYAIIYNSFCKDSTITASAGAGGIIGEARGGRYENVYSNATVLATERAGGLAGTGVGYIKNSSAYRRLQVEGFYFTGQVTAQIKYAGGLFGYYTPGEQQRNGDGSEYLGEYLPIQYNAPTLKNDGTTVDAGKVYLQKIVIASESVAAGQYAAVVSNHASYTSENGEVGTSAGTIPKLYIYEGIQLNASPVDTSSRLGSTLVTRAELGSQAFYADEVGLNSNYWNYMGLSNDLVADASIIPQGDGTLELNLPDTVADSTYDVDVMADNYVQDEYMVLWLDALNNTGHGFDPDAAYWTNLATLVNGDGEPESYKLNNFTKGSWKSNGLYFSGGTDPSNPGGRQYIAMIDNGELGKTVRTNANGERYTGATLSVMLKLDEDTDGKNNYLFYNRSSVLGGFEIYFSNSNSTYLYVDNVNLHAGTSGTLEQGFNNGSWPSLYNPASGKDITQKYTQLTMVVRTYPDLNQTEADIYLDGELFYTTPRRTGGFESRYGNKLWLGISGVGSNYCSIKGTVGSVLGYDRALTAEEVAQNARVNQLRYNSRVDGEAVTSITKTGVSVSGGKAKITLTSDDYLALFGEEEAEGRQLYVRLQDSTGQYVGGSVTYPHSRYAPEVESTAYVDAGGVTPASDVDEASNSSPATGSGWDYRNQPYVKVTVNDSALRDISYQWYSSNTCGYGGKAIAGETSDTLQLSGSGYYYCRITATEGYMDSESGALMTRTVYGYSRIYRHSTDSYMPYLRSRQSSKNYATLPIQEGFYEKDGTKIPYSTEDAICSGGVPVPGGTSTLSMTRSIWLFGRASDPAPEVRAYAAGANILNLEFDSNIPYKDPSYWGSCWFTLEADGADVILPEGILTPMAFTDEDGKERTGYYIDNRVYSLYYDFRAELTVTTWSEFFDPMTGDSILDRQECQVIPEETARRVMTWDDSYAYINNQDMLNGTIGRISHEGGFVNLYRGKALTADGLLLDVTGLPDGSDGSGASDAEAEPSYTQADTALAVLPESVPLYTGSYGGFDIETYAGFTSTTREEQRYTSSRQLFVKNGQLFTTGTIGDGNQPVQDGYILDTYQSYRYLTVLESGVRTELKDVEQPIHYPSGFANYNIAHISNTLDNSADSHIVLGCYESGSIWGFDYFTGEWLELDSDANGGNFLTYLLGSVRARFFNTIPAANPAYENALALETSLGVYLLENGDELPEGGTSGYGDTVDDGSLLSLDQETAIPTEEPGVINANGDTAEEGSDQSEGTALTPAAEETSASDPGDRDKASEETDDLSVPGGVLKEQTDVSTEEVDERPGEKSGMTGMQSDEALKTPEAGTAADSEGNEAYGIPTDESESPEQLTDGHSAADGTAVAEAQPLRQNEELLTVYDTSTGTYGVYDAIDILTASDEQLVTADVKYAKMGMDLHMIRISQKDELTDKEQQGIDMILAASGGVFVLLAGMFFVHRRKRRM